MARALMFQGTGSDVGKTVLVAGLCRAAYHRGLRVKPFKPQNMSNNAAVALEGGEIGRGQWLQALACKVDPSIHMNPVLLKPQSAAGAQIILQGKYVGDVKARDYAHSKQQLKTKAVESFRKVSEGSDLVLVEGAGSPAEINLRKGDIANMGFAEAVNIPVVLIGDIDRGGVIASLVGTYVILNVQDRLRIKGYIINKFRGDATLFDDGLKAIGDYTNWPNFGVVPWLPDFKILPAEDSMKLNQLSNQDKSSVKIVVPVTSHIANFDDLDPLMNEPGVDIIFVRHGETIPTAADAVILPGSKSTIADMIEMHKNGWARQIIRLAQSGTQVIGICGGFQMLGQKIADPYAIEGSDREVQGLKLLRITTELTSAKTVRNIQAQSLQFGVTLSGYEIHMGKTTGESCAQPVFRVDGVDEGATSETGAIWGTYIHGLFESGAFRRKFLTTLGAESDGRSHLQKVDYALDRIACSLEKALDLDSLFALAQ